MIPFVKQPSLQNLKDYKLQYLDILTYFSLISYRNNESGIAFPSFDRLVATSGLSKDFINKSLKRIESAGLINVKRAAILKSVNKYTFKAFSKFEMIPLSLLQDEDLLNEEKATLICIRQFFYSDSLTTSFTIKEMAKKLQINYDTLDRHILSLKRKGYINNGIKYISTKQGTKTVWSDKKTLVLDNHKINWKLEEKVPHVLDQIDLLNLTPEMIAIALQYFKEQESNSENDRIELIVE